MRNLIRAVRRFLVAFGVAGAGVAFAQAPITLHGAVQFNDDHAFNKSLLKFEELVKSTTASRSTSSSTATASSASRRTTSPT